MAKGKINFSDEFNALVSNNQAEEVLTKENGRELRYTTKTVKIEELVPNPLNMYSMEEDEDFEELLDILKKDGLRNPIEVLPKDENGKYRILSGHRRREALVKLGIEECPIRIIKSKLSKSEEIGYIARGNGGTRKRKPYDVALELVLFYDALDKENYAGNKVDYAQNVFSLSRSNTYKMNNLTKLDTFILEKGREGLLTLEEGEKIVEYKELYPEEYTKLLNEARSQSSNKEVKEILKKMQKKNRKSASTYKATSIINKIDKIICSNIDDISFPERTDRKKELLRKSEEVKERLDAIIENLKSEIK